MGKVQTGGKTLSYFCITQLMILYEILLCGAYEWEVVLWVGYLVCHLILIVNYANAHTCTHMLTGTILTLARRMHIKKYRICDLCMKYNIHFKLKVSNLYNLKRLVKLKKTCFLETLGWRLPWSGAPTHHHPAPCPSMHMYHEI